MNATSKSSVGICRNYGTAPFTVALIHGGPGAAGEMASVARALSKNFGVLEPLQSRKSIAGQIEELYAQLESQGQMPITLIGFSCGAWLSCLFAAAYPKLVKKLILIGCPPFDASYSKAIMQTRLERVVDAEKEKFLKLIEALESSDTANKAELFAQVGQQINILDSYAPIAAADDALEVQWDIHAVWAEAAALRKSEVLLAKVSSLTCPVIAIHGDYDPHPARGVSGPLGSVLKDFEFIVLEKCGHHPWLEYNARDQFYALVAQHINS